MFELVNAVLLGIVEGLTEFIPVSSTGHLIIFGEVLSYTGNEATTFEIFIQLGAILAVVYLYWPRFLKLLPDKDDKLLDENSFSGFAGLLKLFLACLPAFILGFLLHDFIKTTLFTTFTVALALIVGGVIMIIIESRPRQVSVEKLEKISYRKVFLIGCFQCFALWPGMSRSGSTIVGGMLCGLNRRIAAEFSFLVAAPVMVAAVSYDLYKSWHYLSLSNLSFFIVGFLVSFVVAVIAIRFFLSLLSRFTLAPFGYYRIILGSIILLL